MYSVVLETSSLLEGLILIRRFLVCKENLTFRYLLFFGVLLSVNSIGLTS